MIWACTQLLFSMDSSHRILLSFRFCISDISQTPSWMAIVQLTYQKLAEVNAFPAGSGTDPRARWLVCEVWRSPVTWEVPSDPCVLATKWWPTWDHFTLVYIPVHLKGADLPWMRHFEGFFFYLFALIWMQSCTFCIKMFCYILGSSYFLKSDTFCI